VPRSPSVILAVTCRYVLAAVFLAAAVTKITDLAGFTNRLVWSELPFARIVAAVVPWLELTCGLCLALGWAVREAAAILAVLLAALLVYALAHFGQSDCRCFFFPTREPRWTWWTPTRNTILLACAVCVSLVRTRHSPKA